MKNLSTKHRRYKEFVTMNLVSIFHNKLIYNIIIYYLYPKNIEIKDTLFIWTVYIKIFLYLKIN